MLPFALKRRLTYDFPIAINREHACAQVGIDVIEFFEQLS